LFLHIDKNLAMATSQYGTLIYAILFLVVFMETGFVVTPFLPGDSLLFASGALAAVNYLNIWGLYVLFLTAAIVGDTVNYWIGFKVGPRISQNEGRFIKKEYFDKAQEFYAKHGNIAIVLARFVPIVRTFAPFVAGFAKMSYSHFILYNIIGGVIWVTLFLWGGFMFGNIPFVQENFHYLVIGIIGLSAAPIAIEVFRSKFAKKTD
jgi:membrane-associated protein